MWVSPNQAAEYFEFASSVIGEQYAYGPSTKCLTNLSDHGEILAVVIYDRTNGIDCMMHIASDGSRRWLSRHFLCCAFYVPFIQWQQKRITALVRADNEAALRFDRHLGFVQEGLVRSAFDDCDGVLFGMLKQECRFLK